MSPCHFVVTHHARFSPLFWDTELSRYPPFLFSRDVCLILFSPVSVCVRRRLEVLGFCYRLACFVLFCFPFFFNFSVHSGLGVAYRGDEEPGFTILWRALPRRPRAAWRLRSHLEEYATALILVSVCQYGIYGLLVLGTSAGLVAGEASGFFCTLLGHGNRVGS
ncbi:hypothetical protein V8C35DRAFT_223523 [Trichoderma chlorosporum]